MSQRFVTAFGVAHTTLSGEEIETNVAKDAAPGDPGSAASADQDPAALDKSERQPEKNPGDREVQVTSFRT